MSDAIKHTPGPWIVETNEKSARMCVLGPRGDGNNRSSDGFGCLVAVDCAAEPDVVMFSPMLSEQVANARLIATAPELLAALKSLCDADASYVSSKIHIDCDSHGDAIRRMRIAREAIAKAEGRST